jgi:hypothetical protein
MLLSTPPSIPKPTTVLGDPPTIHAARILDDFFQEESVAFLDRDGQEADDDDASEGGDSTSSIATDDGDEFEFVSPSISITSLLLMSIYTDGTSKWGLAGS